MRALSSIPFCPYEGRWVSLWDLSAVCRYTARERETLLLQMLSQMQQQNQRLLDLLRPLPPQTPQDAPHATQPRYPLQRTAPEPHGTPARPPGPSFAGVRGELRRRIVTLLGPPAAMDAKFTVSSI